MDPDCFIRIDCEYRVKRRMVNMKCYMEIVWIQKKCNPFYAKNCNQSIQSVPPFFAENACIGTHKSHWIIHQSAMAKPFRPSLGQKRVKGFEIHWQSQLMQTKKDQHNGKMKLNFSHRRMDWERVRTAGNKSERFVNEITWYQYDYGDKILLCIFHGPNPFFITRKLTHTTPVKWAC